jgi:hypothetical protein
MNTVAFYETLGTCFGRKPEEFKPEIVEEKGEIEREY